jgi:Tfp pilus assembly ATPase PilU
VVNNSWGGGGGDLWYQASVNAWRAASIFPAFSAGNSGPVSGSINTPAVANCIREGKTFMLPGVMQTGKNVGMITMDESLRKLYIQGVITRDECLFRAEDKIQMRAFFQS